MSRGCITIGVMGASTVRPAISLRSMCEVEHRGSWDKRRDPFPAGWPVYAGVPVLLYYFALIPAHTPALALCNSLWFNLVSLLNVSSLQLLTKAIKPYLDQFGRNLAVVSCFGMPHKQLIAPVSVGNREASGIH